MILVELSAKIFCRLTEEQREALRRVLVRGNNPVQDGPAQLEDWIVAIVLRLMTIKLPLVVNPPDSAGARTGTRSAAVGDSGGAIDEAVAEPVVTGSTTGFGGGGWWPCRWHGPDGLRGRAVEPLSAAC